MPTLVSYPINHTLGYPPKKQEEKLKIDIMGSKACPTDTLNKYYMMRADVKAVVDCIQRGETTSINEAIDLRLNGSQHDNWDFIRHVIACLFGWEPLYE